MSSKPFTPDKLFDPLDASAGLCVFIGFLACINIYSTIINNFIACRAWAIEGD
jgi:hypothetical protein